MEVRSIEVIVAALNEARVEYLVVGDLADMANLEEVEKLRRTNSR